jgi:hypothetical protein
MKRCEPLAVLKRRNKVAKDSSSFLSFSFSVCKTQTHLFYFNRLKFSAVQLSHREGGGVPLPPVGSGYPLQVLARLRLPPGFPLLSLSLQQDKS